MNISFFILAGGYGSRAEPLSFIRPKPVFPINGTALINLIFKQLELSGLKSGYINLHYLPEIIKNNIKTDLDIKYIFEKRLSGNAVLSNISHEEEYTLIINGDVFLKIPINDLFKKIRASGADGVLLIRDDKDNNYNKLSNKNINFTEVSVSEMLGKMYTGIAVFKTKILTHFKETSFFTSLEKNNFDIRVLEYDDIWLDLGSPKQYYESVFKYLKYTGISNSNSISNKAYISEDSTLRNTIVWDRVYISGGSKIINSIILDDVIINNLTITNKIVFNQDKKLTLINL